MITSYIFQSDAVRGGICKPNSETVPTAEMSAAAVGKFMREQFSSNQYTIQIDSIARRVASRDGQTYKNWRP